MIQSARILVVVSTVLAAFAEGYLGAGTSGRPQVLWVGAVGFVATLALGQQWRSIAMPVLAAAMYLTPAILYLAFNAVDYGLDAIWILPLLGLILSDRVREWSLPVRWQWPLITWAAIVALAWPIVFLREVDFNLWILPLPRVSNSGDGAPPWLVAQSVAYFALLHNVGILLIDALCRWYRDDLARFRREVLAPLAAAAGIAAVVSVYQGFVDLEFLNTGFWAYMLRASGTLADANKLGAVAGFWTVGAIVFARRMRQPWNLIVSVTALALGSAAVWVSGSRTGLASVVVSLTIAGVEALRWYKLDLRKLAYTGIGAIALGVVMVVILRNASTVTIAQRGALESLPFYGERSIATSLNEYLWDRFGYGPAAIQMIKEHPLAGVGPGIFHSQARDFGELAGRTIPAPDNAQAWWRHNLAELGVLGIIPMVGWCVIFWRTMFSAGAADRDRLATGMLRGLLIAFFIASLFGVPAQSAAISMTFWVFVCWLLLERGHDAGGAPAVSDWRTIAGVAVVIIAAHATVTAVDAFGNLRPRHRAERMGWYYRYGYHISNQGADVEADPGGNPIGRRWTMKKSLAVIEVKGKVLKFVAWVDHPDADQNPVHTQVYADSMLVYEGDLRRTPLFLDIPATPGRTYLTIETSVDRTFRPSDFGSRDDRDLGLSIRNWTWE